MKIIVTTYKNVKPNVDKMVNLKYKWFEKVRETYKNNKSEDKFDTAQLYRCDGLKILNKGFYIFAPVDMTILVKEDYSVLSNVKNVKLQGSNVFDDDKPGPIVKWDFPDLNMFCDEDVSFLCKAMPYPDKWFSHIDHTDGILNLKFSTQLNTQFRIKDFEFNKEYLIKKGAPLCHIVPLTDKKYDLIFKEISYKDTTIIKLLDSFRRFMNFPWPRNIKDSSNAYKKTFLNINNDSKCPFNFNKKE